VALEPASDRSITLPSLFKQSLAAHNPLGGLV
jgi:hypothetical protein